MSDKTDVHEFPAVWADSVHAARFARGVAILLALVIVFLLLVVWVVVTEPDPQPLVVRVNEIGRAEVVDYALGQATADPADPVVPYFLNTFVDMHYARRHGLGAEEWQRSHFFLNPVLSQEAYVRDESELVQFIASQGQASEQLVENIRIRLIPSPEPPYTVPGVLREGRAFLRRGDRTSYLLSFDPLRVRRFGSSGDPARQPLGYRDRLPRRSAGDRRNAGRVILVAVLQPPSPYLDPARRPPGLPPDRVRAFVDLGYDEDLARFAVHVMYMGGVFLPEHTDFWLESNTVDFDLEVDARPRQSIRNAFLRPLFRDWNHIRAVAKAYRLNSVDSQQYGRLDSRYHYKLIGLPYSRYSRATNEQLVVARLMLYDYIVRHPDVTWYGSTDQKKDLFASLQVPQKFWPYHTFTSSKPGVPSTKVYFFDHQPVGLADWHFVFPFAAVMDRSPANLFGLVDTHKPLFSCLRSRGFAVTLVLCFKKGASLPPGVDRYFRAQVPADRLAHVETVWQYLLGLALEFQDEGILAAQGGHDGLRARHRESLARMSQLSPSQGQVFDLQKYECAALPIERGSL